MYPIKSIHRIDRSQFPRNLSSTDRLTDLFVSCFDRRRRLLSLIGVCEKNEIPFVSWNLKMNKIQPAIKMKKKKSPIVFFFFKILSFVDQHSTRR